MVFCSSANQRTISSKSVWQNIKNRFSISSCGCGGIGRRARFRFWCPRRAGSSPVTRIFLENKVFLKKSFGEIRGIFYVNINSKNRRYYIFRISNWCGKDVLSKPLRILFFHKILMQFLN